MATFTDPRLNSYPGTVQAELLHEILEELRQMRAATVVLTPLTCACWWCRLVRRFSR